MNLAKGYLDILYSFGGEQLLSGHYLGVELVFLILEFTQLIPLLFMWNDNLCYLEVDLMDLREQKWVSLYKCVLSHVG